METSANLPDWRVAQRSYFTFEWSFENENPKTAQFDFAGLNAD